MEQQAGSFEGKGSSKGSLDKWKSNKRSDSILADWVKFCHLIQGADKSRQAVAAMMTVLAPEHQGQKVS